LARQHLGINYPNRAVGICDNDFPEAFCEILADDAYLIWNLASVLLDQMDADQRWLHFYGELKTALILNEMSRYGIPVDGAAAAHVYKDALMRMKKLSDEIAEGRGFNLWDGLQVYAILRDREPTSLSCTAGVHKKYLRQG